MKLDQVQQAVKGIPHMELAQGRVIYEHVLEAEPIEILELGTARGVSSAYMAAALDEVGRGKITTLDPRAARVRPAARAAGVRAAATSATSTAPTTTPSTASPCTSWRSSCARSRGCCSTT